MSERFSLLPVLSSLDDEDDDDRRRKLYHRLSTAWDFSWFRAIVPLLFDDDLFCFVVRFQEKMEPEIEDGLENPVGGLILNTNRTRCDTTCF